MTLAFTIENVLNKDSKDCSDSEKLCIVRQHVNHAKALMRETTACYHCQKPIENNLLTVAGVSYHKGCFILLSTAAEMAPCKKNA